MIIDELLLNKLEKLSYLEIESGKRDAIKQELTEFLDFVENLKVLDTKGLPTTFKVEEGLKTYLRTDEVNCNHEIGKFIVSKSANNDGESFIVPKIIE
jgi:aspartyl-tRNA(Asn)/glutamyl-tRNA(Gln) amidotransferase subunit C